MRRALIALLMLAGCGEDDGRPAYPLPKECERFQGGWLPSIYVARDDSEFDSICTERDPKLGKVRACYKTTETVFGEQRFTSSHIVMRQPEEGHRAAWASDLLHEDCHDRLGKWHP